MNFCVDQIDHVELTVPDRFEAAAWYSEILGLEILAPFRFWADDPTGPLMIGTANAQTKIALFTGIPTGSRKGIGFHLLAFRVGGENFLTFCAILNELELKNKQLERVTEKDVVDHSKAWSIYFCDPWGHEIEITTYDYDVVRASFVCE